MIVISQDRSTMVKLENCDLVTARDGEIVAFSPQFPARQYLHGRTVVMEKYVILGIFCDYIKSYEVLEKMEIALINNEYIFSIPYENDENFFKGSKEKV